MNLPFFFVQKIPEIGQPAVLDEENAKHIIQALRMKTGERIQLTDGHGHSAEAEIIDDHKKHCVVKTIRSFFVPRTGSAVTIGISLIKNSNRFEWFVEKAAELGVSAIIPLLCDRTEKQHFRQDRFTNISISAMLQSRQVWLPELHPPTPYKKAVAEAVQQQKFIAHCTEQNKRNLTDLFNSGLDSQIILIGPEGDFTAEEIEIAAEKHFDGVSLGNTRLRTETAGVVAATLLTVY